MALGSTQPLTEMSTRNLPEGKAQPVQKADNLTTICELTVYNLWDPRHLTTSQAFTASYRESFTSFTCTSAFKGLKKQARRRDSFKISCFVENIKCPTCASVQ
jgi:hypothetical protein